jgi:hypothetical protein
MGLFLAVRLPGPALLASIVGVIVSLALLGYWVLRPSWRRLGVFAGAFAVLVAAFLAMRPSNQRDWMPDVRLIPTGTVTGHQVQIHNVRNNTYQSETTYAVRFEDRTYDLDRIQGLDLFLISWGPRHIAHTILSFDFGGGDHLAFSIETRKERHEEYSAIRGFFREYELCVVAGDERDLIRLRSNYRKESVRLYHLNTPPAKAREVFMDYVDRINGLAAHPEWYNALTDNCTTALIVPVRRHSSRLPWSWKLVASGHLDELLYDAGFLDRSAPFAELRERVLINDRAQLANDDPAFSLRIREGQPAPRNASAR